MSAIDDGSFDRWRGGVDEKLRGHAEDIGYLRKETHANTTRITLVERVVDKLAVKLGVAAALGSIAGGGVVSFLVLWASHRTH